MLSKPEGILTCIWLWPRYNIRIFLVKFAIEAGNEPLSLLEATLSTWSLLKLIKELRKCRSSPFPSPSWLPAKSNKARSWSFSIPTGKEPTMLLSIKGPEGEKNCREKSELYPLNNWQTKWGYQAWGRSRRYQEKDSHSPGFHRLRTSQC